MGLLQVAASLGAAIGDALYAPLRWAITDAAEHDRALIELQLLTGASIEEAIPALNEARRGMLSSDWELARDIAAQELAVAK